MLKVEMRLREHRTLYMCNKEHVVLNIDEKRSDRRFFLFMQRMAAKRAGK